MRVHAREERVEGHARCFQIRLSASFHWLHPPQLHGCLRDAAPDSFFAERFLRCRIRPSIGSGRFSDSPLPMIVKKQHKRRLKNTAAAGVLGRGRHGGTQGCRRRGRGRGNRAGRWRAAPREGSPGQHGHVGLSLGQPEAQRTARALQALPEVSTGHGALPVPSYNHCTGH